MVTQKTLKKNLLSEATDKRSVPRELAQSAFEKTMRALDFSNTLTKEEKIRAENYFWAIIRKQATKRNSDACLQGRFLLSSIVADLRSIGFSDDRILVDLERDWEDRVPHEVMQEFRQKLSTLKVAV